MIDFKPLLDNVLWPLVVAIVPVLGTWLAYRLARLLKINEQNKNRPILDQAMATATNLLLQELDKLRAQSGSLIVHVGNETVAKYANYVVQQVPEVLRTVGVTPEQVQRKLLAEVLKTDKVDIIPSPPAMEATTITGSVNNGNA